MSFSAPHIQAKLVVRTLNRRAWASLLVADTRHPETPGENTASDDTFLALRDKVRRIAANIAKLLRQ
jgi:hypothetical protein